MAATFDLLFSIEEVCTLHKVTSTEAHQVLAAGPLNILSGTAVYARVGDVSWQLQKDAAVLKYDARTYTFALVDSADVLCLVVSADAHPDCLETFDALLSSTSGFQDVSDISTAAVVPAGTAVPPAAVLRSEQDFDNLAAGETVILVELTAADHVADGIAFGGRLVARGLFHAASLTSKGLATGADFAVRHINAGPPVPVSQATRDRMQHIQNAAHSVSSTTGRVVDGVKDVAVGALTWTGGQLGKLPIFKTEGGGGKRRAVRRLGSAGVGAVVDVYNGLEQAALVVLTSGSAAAGQVIEHRYGEEMGAASRQGLTAAGDVAGAWVNVTHLKPSAFLRKVGRGAAKDVFLRKSASGKLYEVTPTAASVPEMQCGDRRGTASVAQQGPLSPMQGRVTSV